MAGSFAVMTSVHRHSRAEVHRTGRAGWLRATVLGANDGIVSTGALLVGVAGAGSSHSAVLTAGIAGLVAGSASMGIGEFVSVSSQADSENAERATEAAELEEDPAAELHELRVIYQRRGLSHDLAQQVAEALMAHDPLEAHLRDELGLTEELRARPVQAALSSASSFALGAAIPLITALLVPDSTRSLAIAVATIVACVVLGVIGATFGGADRLRGALRVGIGGTAALAATYLIGQLVGGAHRLTAACAPRRRAAPAPVRTRDPGVAAAGSGYCCHMNDFLTDITTLRERARAQVEKGPITEAYGADRERVISVLNEALATEIVCVLRYKRHYFMASGISSGKAAEEFLQHANEEMGHVDLIAERITQLQGEPNFSPAGIEDRSHAEYVEGDTLQDMIREDLVAERVAIESYSEIIRWLGDKDPTTRVMLETILAVEEEHADDLLNLMADHKR